LMIYPQVSEKEFLAKSQSSTDLIHTEKEDHFQSFRFIVKHGDQFQKKPDDQSLTTNLTLSITKVRIIIQLSPR
jgi:LPS O-antigen subunit length determinant protein (WzzB/FepE family)